MIHYQRVHGVTLADNTGLPTINRTPEGAAMGSIPGWSVFFDPDYLVGNGIRNRAQPNFVAQVTSESLSADEFPNGATACQSDGTMLRIGAPVNRGGVNPERFTIFAVVGDIQSGSTNRQYVSFPDGGIEGEITPTAAIARLPSEGSVSYQLVFYEEAVNEIGRPTRLASENFDLDANPANLVMWTFSIEQGVSIWLNGERVAANSGDTRPLTAGYGADVLGMMHRFNGKFGMSGLLNIDLNDPENTGHRRAIEKFLMAKYGIPGGPQ